ncbi:MAG TPA: histidinol-phosphate transaminase [Candidatus Saccharimonadales bacterium]|nr:histidinol-phosphate transaminase [Candidatus Saccharimonadales bacterium]
MKKINVKQFIRTDISQMEPYVPGTSAQKLANIYRQSINQLIKLNANENPYGESPAVRKALKNTLFSYYPSSDYPTLSQQFAKYAKVKKENIIVGSGSDELIDLLLRITLEPGDKVINCPPTFGMYEIYTRLNRGIIMNVQRVKSFEINLLEILKNCKDKKVKIVFLCNPNSPTGNLIPQEKIEKILQTGKLVVVDETYYEFSKQTSIKLLNNYENLIIIRTLSKWAGIAGLRIGYAIASIELISQLMKIKPPFNVNVAAENAALATLKDLSYAKESIKKITNERERIINELNRIPEINSQVSYGNFIFIQTTSSQYSLLQNSFETNKIAVRYYPNLNYGIRITIGKPEQNDRILKIFNKVFNKKRKYAFLDRDGTLIFEPQDTFQVDSARKLKILDGTIKGLKSLKERGYKLIMVTNQDGMGTPIFPKKNFEEPQGKMIEIFENEKIEFENIFICPHFASANCDCRKPKIGLVKKIVNKNTIDKKNSFVCGDRESDRRFAKNLGISFIPIKTNGNFYDAITRKGVPA